jgi:hypothetical protein
MILDKLGKANEFRRSCPSWHQAPTAIHGWRQFLMRSCVARCFPRMQQHQTDKRSKISAMDRRSMNI